MLTSLLLPMLLAAAGFGAGSQFGAWRARRAATARRCMPKQWRLHARSIVNSQEAKVWGWLVQTFPQHHVMVKLPLTRFTLPHQGEDSARLYELLTGVYCTFAICRDDGRVVGCVDVPGARGMSQSNRQIKDALLSQCGMAYRVLVPSALPRAQAIRAAFLGAEAVPSGGSNLEPEGVSAAEQKLRAAVTLRRLDRPAASGGPSEDPGDARAALERRFMSSGWQQADSFVAPLDSRPVELR